jgi:hypothetical protein
MYIIGKQDTCELRAKWSYTHYSGINKQFCIGSELNFTMPKLSVIIAYFF